MVIAEKCKMCGVKEMKPVMGISGETTFKWCPNCDHPRGKMPSPASPPS